MLVLAQCWQGRRFATGKTMWVWSETERNEGDTTDEPTTVCAMIEHDNTFFWKVFFFWPAHVDSSCFGDASQMFLFGPGR